MDGVDERRALNSQRLMSATNGFGVAQKQYERRTLSHTPSEKHGNWYSSTSSTPPVAVTATRAAVTVINSCSKYIVWLENRVP